MINNFKVKLMSTFLMVLISCFFFNVLFAQTEIDSLKAAKLLAAADSLTQQQKYTPSSTKALEAISIFEASKDWDNWIAGFNQIFYNTYYSDEYAKGISILEKKLPAIPNDRPDILAQMNYYLGFMHDASGNLFVSLEHYEASAQSFTTTKNTGWLPPVVYGSLGTGYIKTGDYDKAIGHLKSSLLLAKASGDSSNLYSILYNLADAYYHQGDLDNAKKNYQAAYLIENPKDGDYEYTIAKILLDQKQYQQAIESAQKAIQLSGTQKDQKAKIELLLGEIHLANQAPQKALALFKKQLPYYQTISDQRELAKLYLRIGDAQNVLNQNNQALTNYQTALQLILPTFKEKNPTLNPPLNTLSREIWLIEIFRGKGNCFLAKYQSDKNEDWLGLAEGNYQLAIDAIQQIKLGFETTSSKLSLGSYTHVFYEDLIKVHLERFEINQDRQYLENAFQVAQTANAFVLRALLSEQEALQLANVDPEDIQNLRNIQQEIRQVSGQIETQKNIPLDSLYTALSVAKLKQQTLKKSIAEKYPSYAQLRNDLNVATSKQIQNELENGSLFIKYFLGVKTLYTFSISQSGLQIYSSPLSKDFENLVFQYRRAISQLDFIKKSPKQAEQEYLHSARRLYQILLEKVLDQHDSEIHRLVIVADGLLNTIPFQTLLIEESNSWTDPKKFLLSKYAVSYTYFSKMILDHPPSSKHSDLVAFGLEFDDYTLEHLQNLSKDSIKNEIILENLRSGKFSKLPFSDDEAKEVAILMGGKPWVNEQATKSNFLKHATNANIIHVATHSILDQNNPKHSSLIFTKKRDSADNLLSLDEIYKLQLDADLIVLSACNTGFGPGRRGEGINSLARAFNFAGIPSITATFWSVSDESSKKIMKLYYEFLKNGHPKDIALQKAQLNYLTDDAISSPVFRLPVYWAAWMQVGETRELEGNKKSSFWFGLILLAGVLFFFGMYLGRRKFSD